MIVPARYDSPEVRGLLDELAAHYVTVYGAHDLDDDDPADYVPPDGGCLVGYEDGAPAGVACWRRYDPATCELCRFYVLPHARGRGLARRMLAAALAAACAAGYPRAVCATTAGGGLTGFDVYPCAPFGRYADLPGVGCYELRFAAEREVSAAPSPVRFFCDVIGP